MNRRRLLSLACSAAGIRLPTPQPKLHEFTVQIWLARLFELDQVPMTFTTYAACHADVWDWLDKIYPHHEIGDPAQWTSAWRKSVGAAWEVPYRVEWGKP